ncbi:hypothetical protein OC25_02385 [Pedobacter kyungheensis]|uniref:Uncharacterized protein n=2 Tax=Pedobacter kyungheensis TaxID=1069985 RepID=A0A0C1FUM0_9SPHI|nr:hypothetical protein OC25_02385 [Pedobacter kyungheensis]
MDMRFTITVSLQGPGEKKTTYGRFCIGDDKNIAMEIFSRLSGKPENDSGFALIMEFFEEVMGLPVPCGRLYCALGELKENIAFISKEIFRIANLENKDIAPLS